MKYRRSSIAFYLLFLALALSPGIWRIWSLVGLGVIVLLVLLHGRLGGAPYGEWSTKSRAYEMNLAFKSRNEILMGALMGFFVCMPGYGHVIRPAYALLAFAAGSAAGLGRAWRYGERARPQLERGEHLEMRFAPARYSLGWWLLWGGLLAGLLLGFKQPELWNDRRFQAVIAAISGYAITRGTYLWLWARSREREGFRPLVVRLLL